MTTDKVYVSHLPEYSIWNQMKQRCTNPKHISYPNYGGRGVSCSSRWDSFEQFYSDMGPRPTDKHQIDRVNNNGDYEPGNTRWVLRATNNRNKRNCVISEKLLRVWFHLYVEYGWSQLELQEYFGIHQQTVSRALNGKTWKGVLTPSEYATVSEVSKNHQSKPKRKEIREWRN